MKTRLRILAFVILLPPAGLLASEIRIPSTDGTRELIQADGIEGRLMADTWLYGDADFRQAADDLLARGYLPGEVAVTYTQRTGTGLPADAVEGRMMYWIWEDHDPDMETRMIYGGRDDGVMPVTARVLQYRSDGLIKWSTYNRVSMDQPGGAHSITEDGPPAKEPPSNADYRNGNVLPPSGASNESEFYAAVIAIIVPVAAVSMVISAPALLVTGGSLAVAGALFHALFW